jgi:hypothetical protein
MNAPVEPGGLRTKVMQRHFARIFLAFACVSLLAFRGAALAEVVAPASVDLCYAVGGSTSPDEVVRINRMSGMESDVGPAGVDGVQALTFPPSGTVPFAATADTLGTINANTGAFTPVGGAFGTTVHPTAIPLDNVVGLAWDSLKDQPSVLYAVHRRLLDDDMLFVVDSDTGLYVPNAFGANMDYVVVSGADVECQADIEDIAFDPVSALLYAISNDDGDGDALITIAPLDGECTGIDDLIDTADFPIDNMGGLTFSQPYGDPNSGWKNSRLYGTTGDPSLQDNENKFWTINPETAEATEVSTLTIAGDYEAVACPTGPCDHLRLSMSHSGIGISGSTVTFRIYWTNVCIGQDFPSVTIRNTLPSGLEVISATSNAAAVTTAGNTVTLNAGTVLSSQLAGLAKVKARVVTTGGSIINQAVLTDGFGRQVTANDTVLVHAAKTELTLKLKGQSTTGPGRQVTYMARYRNVTGTNELTMTLPSALATLTSIFPSDVSIAGNVLTWQNLPSPTGLVKVSTTVSPGVSVPSILTVTAAMSDSSGASDTRSQDTLVDNPVVSKAPAVPGLSITAPSTVTRGLVAQLTARYRNVNGSAIVQVNLPPELVSVQLTVPKADSNIGGVLTWNALPAPTGTIKIKALVSSTASVGAGITVTGTLMDASGARMDASDTTAVR